LTENDDEQAMSFCGFFFAVTNTWMVPEAASSTTQIFKIETRRDKTAPVNDNKHEKNGKTTIQTKTGISRSGHSNSSMTNRTERLLM
jgi:hypothetical protein